MIHPANMSAKELEDVLCAGRAKLFGAQSFKSDFETPYAYQAGSMYRGISSPDMIIQLRLAGIWGYLGLGGLSLGEAEDMLTRVRAHLGLSALIGANLLANPREPEMERVMVDMLLKHSIRAVEASAYMKVSAELVRFRVTGIHLLGDEIIVPNFVQAKVSRIELAQQFMRPPPSGLIRDMKDRGVLSEDQALLAERIPLAQDICMEADSGGHTDGGVALALVPAAVALRDALQMEYRFSKPTRVGAAGGIGTPWAIAAAFVLGADFVATGSVNQCTLEAGTSELVKDILQNIGIHDTAYAPAADLFEWGSRVQVVKRGLSFHSKANKLYNTYLQYPSISEMPTSVLEELESKILRKPIEEVMQDLASHHAKKAGGASKAARHVGLASVCRWYLGCSTQWAMQGMESRKEDFQIHCGPALGAFNQWVKGTHLESWRTRKVADVARVLMAGAGMVH